jgi:tetrapyrrole methylase family protein / MazG family protein
MNNNEKHPSPMETFGEFLAVIKKLRAPDGCPWDRKQTPTSLRGDLLEEAYECIDAINNRDNENLREELGDLFLLTTMISYIEEQEGAFTVAEVLSGVTNKLIRRHPHVFADAKASNAEEVITQWDAIKRDVEGKDGNGKVLSTVPDSLPPLEKAHAYQKKAAKTGFDWATRDEVLKKVMEEIEELKALDTMKNAGPSEAEKELGDLLFSVVNLCRHYKVDPVLALHRTNKKFFNRFGHVETQMNNMGKKMSTDALDLMEKLWNDAKLLEE